MSLILLSIEIAASGSSIRADTYNSKGQLDQSQHQIRRDDDNAYPRRGYNNALSKEDTVEFEEFLLLDMVGLPTLVTPADLRSLENIFLSAYSTINQREKQLITAPSRTNTASGNPKFDKRRRAGASIIQPTPTTLDVAYIIPDAIENSTPPSPTIEYLFDDRTATISMQNFTYLLIVRGERNGACTTTGHQGTQDVKLFGSGTNGSASKSTPNDLNDNSISDIDPILLLEQDNGHETPSENSGKSNRKEFVSSNDDLAVIAKFMVHQNKRKRVRNEGHDSKQQIRRSFILQRRVDQLQSSSNYAYNCGGLSDREFIEKFNQLLINQLSDGRTLLSGNIAGLLGVQQVSLVAN